jgi:medium-chain acyl-[acyl-carrier-protein] hydrolase
MREIPHRRMEALVDAVSAEILPLVDRPFAFFGHSMGGLLSYELTRRLQHLRRPLPLCLILSASLPPNRWENAVPRHTLSDQELIAELSRMNGTPRAILHNAELMDLLLPLLRADFELCETYRPSSPSPLNIPTTLVVGREDSHVTKEDLVGWDACICAPRELVIIPGDHFFIHTARHELLERITSVLASVTRSTREEKNR